ncbi:MAG: hypothetical protein QOH43_2621 [Solirubrobacteraceae bacterium]|jgi:hypothetical protein|nr:hypothetical protein [Solirubrobacteraceae bacterium]
MKPTRTRVVGVAAALSAIALAAPMSTAGAATGAPRFAGPVVAGGWGGFIALPSTEPIVGQEAAVIGPAIITTAPTTFINTNNQVTAGDTWSGGQVGP